MAAAHVAARNLSFDPLRGPFVATVARRHLALLASAVLLVLAFGAWLRIPQLLSTPGGVLFGASYTDVVARMPASWALAAAALAGAGLAAWQAATPRFWPIGTAVGLYLAVALGGERLRDDHPAFRRGAERAGARDPLHRAQHRGDAGGFRARHRWRSGSCRATPG